MDPITAIGLASAILTFVDFSYSLVNGMLYIANSAKGITEENEHSSNMLEELQKATKGLDRNLKGSNEHEIELSNLATNCRSLSSELAAVLEKLTVKDKRSKLQRFRISLASRMKQDTVATIQQRLMDYRQAIVLRLNLMLWWANSLIVSSHLSITFVPL